MRKTLIFNTLLAAALCGFACAEDYTLDGTDEPDVIPGVLETNEVDAPASIVPSEKSAADDKTLILPGDVPVKPPKLMRNETGQLVLVQYSSRNRRQEELPETPIPDMPAQYQDFNTMNESERLSALKQSIQTVLKTNARRGVNTLNHTPNDVLLMALPYGADSRVYQPNPNANPRNRNVPQGEYIYSIGALCWNTPCRGKTLLRSDGSKIIARVGYGYQRQPAAFSAMLAMSNIMPNYELKVGSSSYTIEHLIASERMAVSKNTNLSMALVALSFYGKTSDQWKNETDETWNIEKMVTSELNRSFDQGSSDAADWLLGLTAAVKLYEGESKPIRGPLALAKKQLQTYHEFVLSIQNDRYLWHPKFFLYKGFNPDAFETMYSSGHILRWLIYSLPDNDLKNPQIERSVMSLAATVNRVKPDTLANALTSKELEGLAVSLHALTIYYQRTFGESPFAAPAEEKTEEKAVAVR